MEMSFPAVMASLRKEKYLSQRQAAAALGISQALLSHYEKGTREPGLDFLCRACEFYNVSADYLLGRTSERGCSDSVMKKTRDTLSDIIKAAQSALKEIE